MQISNEYQTLPLTQSEQNERVLQEMYPDQFLSQETIKAIYEEIKPTFMGSITQRLAQITCSHNEHWLVKHKLVRSTRERDVNTVREYQYIRLSLGEQHWACKSCGKISTLAQPVSNQYREEHYL